MIKRIKDGVIGLVTVFCGLSGAVLAAKMIYKYVILLWNLW